jgi:hypothetical protein
MKDEELHRLIREDIDKLSALPASHIWSELANDLQGGEDEETPDELLLKTLAGQGRILIRQNELILRILRRAFPNTATEVLLSPPKSP